MLPGSCMRSVKQSLKNRSFGWDLPSNIGVVQLLPRGCWVGGYFRQRGPDCQWPHTHRPWGLTEEPGWPPAPSLLPLCPGVSDSPRPNAIGQFCK